MGKVTRRQLTDLLGMLGVVAVLAGLAIGLPAVDAALPANRPVSPDRRYEIGAGVTVLPPSGAVLDVTATRPGDLRGSALFRLGPVRYLIAVRPFHGDVEAAAASLRARITGTPGYQVTGTQRSITTDYGRQGLQGGYTAPGRSGRYAVFVASGLSAEVTVAGADLDLGHRLSAVERSTMSLRFPEQS
ncbi:hypothetical protein [Mangrovihabitans endophyticus]|uniref:Uncharacterized protein n=1 Tax=Mangrovihabitans endophyticus TaxID=1751298 RepID=A0A8J3FNR7_9ACTN|nr:hypothetical protein [Mangrovihabitans endophyticus]GGK95434.1 hypothetical protein GCM10012284_31910 [Mangrovihabitans endophyticus]